MLIAPVRRGRAQRAHHAARPVVLVSALALLVRNNMAFHLGDLEHYERGLDRVVADGRPVVLIEAEGGKYRDSRSPFAMDLLIRGLGVDTADWEKLFELGAMDPAPILDALELTLHDLLHGIGVDFDRASDERREEVT